MPKSEIKGVYDDRRKLKFLKELAISSHVANSAKAAGVAVSTVYLWRQRDPDFNKLWMRSLAAGYELLEMELLDRARNGVDRPVFHAGKRVATVRHFNDGLGLKLLLAHQQMVALTRAAQDDISPAQVRASLDRKLSEMRAKLLRREALANGQASRSGSAHDE